MSIRKFILATAAAGGLAFFTAGAAGASSTNESALDALEELCEDRGGLPVNSPVRDLPLPGRPRQQGLRGRATDLRGPRRREVRRSTIQHDAHEPRLVGVHLDGARGVITVRAGRAVPQPLRPASRRVP